MVRYLEAIENRDGGEGAGKVGGAKEAGRGAGKRNRQAEMAL